MNCIITAGPTYEPLDEVRSLTNFSTGRLGSELATYLTSQGHTVTLLIGQQATYRGNREARRVQAFTTTDDLRSRLYQMSTQPCDAIFHAAAVSDFTFGKVFQREASNGALLEVKAGKISTRLNFLLVELLPTSKIIAELRRWFPRALLVGWKFEVDGDRAGVLTKASTQLEENQTNATIANGRAYGDGFGLVTGPAQCRHLSDTASLYQALNDLLVAHAKTRPAQ